MKKNPFFRLLALLLVLTLVPVAPAAASGEDVVIILDPGHGGMDTGATVKYDGAEVCESVLCLKIANYCRDYLEEHYQNVQVHLTRETDKRMELSDRVAFAVEQGADYVLSIHLNYVKGYAHGALALVPRGKYHPELKALGVANALGLAESLGLQERRQPSSADLGDTPFEDVLEGEWYYDDVTYVWEQGLMEGVSETAFGPAQAANRAMVVTLLYHMDGAEVFPEESSFSDVPVGSWCHAPVEWALEKGITKGVTETEFAPVRNVVREQFVTFLHRYAGEPEPAELPEQLADWDSVSGYAQGAVAWAVETGLVNGYDDGTIRPNRELNRAELAVLMHRFHLWWLHEQGEQEYEWEQSDDLKELHVGESA